MTPRVECHTLFVDYGYRAREIATPAKIGPSCPGGRPFSPYPQEFLAIWDTGATHTTITEDLAKKLGLYKIREHMVAGVTGNALCNAYLIALGLPNGIVFPEIEVMDCAGNIGCDILIGMDVIGLGDFAVCNFRGNTTFSFRTPSVAVLDFTAIDDPAYAKSKVGRNDRCPCGSGKKFKKCHGANR
jgi:hypothetical protein